MSTVLAIDDRDLSKNTSYILKHLIKRYLNKSDFDRINLSMYNIAELTADVCDIISDEESIITHIKAYPDVFGKDYNYKSAVDDFMYILKILSSVLSNMIIDNITYVICEYV